MTQDRASGAAGNRYGREMAALVARLLGTHLTSFRSNEADFGGRRVVIKCAAPKTDQVGVVTTMLDRVDFILGAFEEEDGSIKVWALPTETFKTKMEESRSASHRPGTLMKVRNRAFLQQNDLVGSFSRTEVSAARRAR